MRSVRSLSGAIRDPRAAATAPGRSSSTGWPALRRVALGLAAAVALGACRSAPPPPATPYPDERPDHVAESAVAGVVVLSGMEGGVGSGVAVDDDVLLTALHVWTALSARAPLEAAGEGPAPPSPFAGGARLRVDGRETRAVAIAVGELRQPHGDWALVRIEDPTWRPRDVLALHLPALDPAWRPDPGTPLWLVGYATHMFPPEGVDPRAPARMVSTTVSRVPSTRRAELAQACLADDRGLDLAGMSGGAACVWNEADRRLELLGTFIGRFEVVRRIQGPLGLGIVSGRVRHLLVHLLPIDGLARVGR